MMWWWRPLLVLPLLATSLNGLFFDLFNGGGSSSGGCCGDGVNTSPIASCSPCSPMSPMQFLQSMTSSFQLPQQVHQQQPQQYVQVQQIPGPVIVPQQGGPYLSGPPALDNMFNMVLPQNPQPQMISQPHVMSQPGPNSYMQWPAPTMVVQGGSGNGPTEVAQIANVAPSYNAGGPQPAHHPPMFESAAGNWPPNTSPQQPHSHTGQHTGSGHTSKGGGRNQDFTELPEIEVSASTDNNAAAFDTKYQLPSVHEICPDDELRAVLIRSYQGFLVDSRYSGCNTHAINRQLQEELKLHYGLRSFETIVSLGDFVIRSHANRSQLFCKIPLDDKIIVAYATPESHVDITVKREQALSKSSGPVRKMGQFTRLLADDTEAAAVSGESPIDDAYDDYALMEELPKMKNNKKKATKPKKNNRRTRSSTHTRGGNKMGYRYGIA